MNWKPYLYNRLKIVGFIFALVGWFLMVTVSLEQIFNKDLSNLEEAIQSPIVNWGLKIFMIVILIVLIKWQDKINSYLNRNIAVKIFVKFIYIGGAVGWVVGLSSLIIK